MTLGVVMKCGDDPRVLRCLDSVDYPASVVVAGFFSPALAARLDARGVPRVDAPRGNLGRTTALGIRALATEKLVIMDSDSWFGPGTLARLDRALDDAPFARARIRYAVGPGGSRVVARTRQHLNDTLQRAYTPGLGMRREVASQMGGHLFDDRICFAEDAEMDWRRRERGIPLLCVEHAEVWHAPVTKRHDLRAAYRVGYGKAQQVQRTDRPNDEDPLPLLRRAAAAEQPRALASWTRELGYLGAAYNVAWFMSYYLGYYDQRVSRRHG